MAKNKSIRWRPAMIILALSGLALIWIWFFLDTIRQYRFINTFATGVLTSVFLLIWVMFFSRLRVKIRWFTLGITILGIVLFVSLFKYREISGDLVPIFEWRWSNGAIRGDLNSDADMANITPPGDLLINYPQFLGPARTAVIPDIKLEQNWETNPPEKMWRQPIGEGWSAFAVLGGYAVTQEQRGDDERVVCYALNSGKIIWTHADQARFDTPLGGIGPRATPTIDSGKVYTFGAKGHLNCLDLKTGDRIWHANIVEEHNAKMPTHGFSSSPLVLDSLLIVSAGATQGPSLLAYNKDSGNLVWAAGDDPAGYTSPMLITLANRPQLLDFNNAHAVAHDPVTGKILWKYPRQQETPKVAQPIVLPEDKLFVSNGYSIRSKMFQITQDTNGDVSPTLLWESNRLKSKFANVLYHDGFIYGLDDGIMVCLDPADGKRRWKRGRYGHGQMMLIGNIILVLEESGDVVLVEPTPEAHIEVTHFSAIDGKTWNHPAFAAPYLLVRNSQEAACYKLPIVTNGT